MRQLEQEHGFHIPLTSANSSPTTKNGKLTFSAYSPADATGTATFDVVKGLKIANFNVDSDLTKQYDLLYSNRTYNKTNSTSGSNNTYDGVDLTFNHALSSIHVKVVTDKEYPAGTVNERSMYLENVWCTGTFVEDLATGTETVSYSTARWEGQSDERLLEVGKTEQSVTATATKYGNTALLIPQKFDHSGVHKVTLTVNYTITNGDGTNLDQVAKFALDSQGVKEWIKGYRYTYNLTFALDQIYFAPTVEEWKDASLSFPAI